MNGWLWKSMQRAPALRARTLARAVVVLGVASSLGACADIQRATSLPPVNPESPVATAVANAARRSYPTPSLRDVPPAPKNVPTPGAVKLAVVSMVRCRRGFERYAATHPQIVSGGPEFAAQARTAVDTNPADLPTAEDAANTQAYAAKLRAYAAAPAPITSGPPPSPAEGLPPPPPAPAHSSAAAPHPHAQRAPRPARPPAAEPAPASVEPAPAQPVDVASTGVIALMAPLPPAERDPLLALCP